MAKEKIEGKASEPVASCDQLPEVTNIKRLNEQVKRNIERFPDFMFQLTKEEFEENYHTLVRFHLYA